MPDIKFGDIVFVPASRRHDEGYALVTDVSATFGGGYRLTTIFFINLDDPARLRHCNVYGDEHGPVVRSLPEAKAGALMRQAGY